MTDDEDGLTLAQRRAFLVADIARWKLHATFRFRRLPAAGLSWATKAQRRRPKAKPVH
jgi:hypothetical protein